MELARSRAGRRGRATATAETRADDTTGIRRLVTDEDQCRLLVDAVEDYAIIALDTSGRVTGWNSGAERIKGRLMTSRADCMDLPRLRAI